MAAITEDTDRFHAFYQEVFDATVSHDGPAGPGMRLSFVHIGPHTELNVFEIDGKLLIVDCGVLFPEETQPGVDLILPDFSYIQNRLDDIVAVVLTHGHEDHIGALPYVLPKIPGTPIYATRLTEGFAMPPPTVTPTPPMSSRSCRCSIAARRCTISTICWWAMPWCKPPGSSAHPTPRVSGWSLRCWARSTSFSHSCCSAARSEGVSP